MNAELELLLRAENTALRARIVSQLDALRASADALEAFFDGEYGHDCHKADCYVCKLLRTALDVVEKARP